MRERVVEEHLMEVNEDELRERDGVEDKLCTNAVPTAHFSNADGSTVISLPVPIKVGGILPLNVTSSSGLKTVEVKVSDSFDIERREKLSVVVDATK
jgi:hypothetical protein